MMREIRLSACSSGMRLTPNVPVGPVTAMVMPSVGMAGPYPARARRATIQKSHDPTEVVDDVSRAVDAPREAARGALQRGVQASGRWRASPPRAADTCGRARGGRGAEGSGAGPRRGGQALLAQSTGASAGGKPPPPPVP